METFWTVCINTFFFSPIPPKTEFSCLLLPIKAPAGIWLADPKHLTQKQKQTPLKIHWNKSYPLTRFFCARSFRVSTFCAEMSFRCRMFSFLTLYFQKPSHRHCSHICLELESRSHSGILKSSPVHSFRWRGKKKKHHACLLHRPATAIVFRQKSCESCLVHLYRLFQKFRSASET